MTISGVDTGLVTGRFVIGLVDGPDIDDEPDLIGATGTFEFTPAITYLPVPGADPGPFTLLKDTFVAVLDDEGYLCTPSPINPTLPGKRGIRLFATDSDASSTVEWTWKVTPKFVGRAGFPSPTYIPPFNMAVPTGSVIDLATVVKVPNSTGIGTEQIVALASTAQQAAQYASRQAAAAAEEASSAGISAYEAAQVSAQALAVSEAAESIAQSVRDEADAGDFIPKISIGEVNTVINSGDDGWVANIIRNGGLTKEAVREGMPSAFKGDPGGLVPASNVWSAQDCNLLTTPGYYYQASGSTIALNWPAAVRGVLTVFGVESGMLTQEFMPQRIENREAKAFYRRVKVGVTGKWSPWEVYSSQRIDTKAGRVVYSWDPVEDREHMIYGDTGWRDISSLLQGFTSSSDYVYIRRTNNLVEIEISAPNPTESVALDYGTLPQGFAGYGGVRRTQFWGQQGSLDSTGLKPVRMSLTSTGMQMRAYGATVNGGRIGISGTYHTNTAWPVTLPGTAV